jgi:Protein kinase domain.
MKATCPDFAEVANLKEISILRKIPDHLNVLCLCETYVNRSTRQVTLVFPLMELNLEEYIRTTDNISEKRAKEILYQVKAANETAAHYRVGWDLKLPFLLLVFGKSRNLGTLIGINPYFESILFAF